MIADRVTVIGYGIRRSEAGREFAVPRRFLTPGRTSATLDAVTLALVLTAIALHVMSSTCGFSFAARLQALRGSRADPGLRGLSIPL